jgi:hypothetical protein
VLLPHRVPRVAADTIVQSLSGDAEAPADGFHEKDLQMQAFSEAAEGIRTLDLLHGKQDVRRRFGTNMPAKGRFMGPGARGGLPGIYREITGVWV